MLNSLSSITKEGKPASPRYDGSIYIVISSMERFCFSTTHQN